MDHFEERHLQSVALLAVRLNCEIPPQLAREISSIADIIDNADEGIMAERLDEKLRMLSGSLSNLDNLDAFTKLELPALLDITGPTFISRLTKSFESIAKASGTPVEAIDIHAEFCVKLLEQKTSSQYDTRFLMYDLCCTLSSQSLSAAKVLHLFVVNHILDFVLTYGMLGNPENTCRHRASYLSSWCSESTTSRPI